MCRLTMMDKRIINRDAISNCFTDSRIAKIDVGKKGYFSKSMYGFHDLDSCVYGELVEVKENTNQPFIHELYTAYDFFISESAVAQKEKKSRPLDLDEFRDRFAIGDVIKLRLKDCSLDLCLMYTGNEYQPSEQGDPYCDSVCLGSYSFSMQTLFDDYEYYFEVEQKWLPFGVEE